jgi:hypothetical protein
MAIVPVLTWATPLGRQDVIFYVLKDSNLPAENQWEYGQAIDGPLKTKYPNHRLSYVMPEAADGSAKRTRWYYVADRADQNTYNWEISSGDELVRTYVVERSKYKQRPDTTVGPDPGEFLWPPVATADAAFPQYGFADDTVVRTEVELDSLYVVVQRRFIRPVTYDEKYDDNLERNVRITRTLIGKATATGTSTAGTTVERQDGNYFHDFRITSEVLLGENEEYPIQITSFITDVPYRFPPLIKSARFVAAWAVATSAQAARSYDEAWYLKYKTVDPVIGPYEARVLRFVTNSPNALRSTYPIQKFITLREDISICRSWAYASDKGNSTYAEARPLEIPPAIHGDLTIENGETLSAGQSTNFLPATPNFATVTGLPSIVVGYESKQAQYGLYIVEVTILNCTGVYSGVTIPFGTQTAPGSLPPDMGADLPDDEEERPDPPSASFSDDNTVISGFSSPGAEVRASVGTEVIGRGVANTDGSFSFAVDVIYTDAQSVVLTAYLDGLASTTTTIASNDLSPLRPTGYLSADMTTLQGTTEPGATLTIFKDASYQVETVTIPTTRRQVETLTVAVTTVTAGDAQLEITWSGFNGGLPYQVQVPVVGGEDAEEVATLGETALLADSTVTAFFTIDRDAEDLILTAITGAANDAGAQMTINNDTSGGVTFGTSVDTVPGSASLTITSDGTVIATVTSVLTSPMVNNFPVFVATADDASAIAAKVASALSVSVINDHYVITSSVNTVILTARVIAADDTTLKIVITAGTAGGFENTGDSVTTTPGSTTVTTTANSSGDYFYAFGAALTAGSQVVVYASDAGGTSLPLILEANASPPVVGTPAIGDSDTITGTGATASAKILVYDGDTEIGDGAIVGGGGAYTVNLDYKLIRGETVQIVAAVNGNEDVRSAPAFLTFTDLNLVVPTFTKTGAGYLGNTPSGASSIRIRKVSDLSETTATLHTNGTFSFTLPDNPPGTAFDVYARYTAGDSDPVRIFTPFIPVRDAIISLGMGYVTPAWGTDVPNGYVKDDPYFYKMEVAIMDWVNGMDVTISFPGTNEADIVRTNIPDNTQVYTPYGYTGSSATIVPGGAINNYAHYVTAVPLDVTGAFPVPFPVVVVTMAYPDGQTKVTTFDRSTYRNVYWRNGSWDYQIYVNPYRIIEWEQYNYIP